jgi:hypothetical protein
LIFVVVSERLLLIFQWWLGWVIPDVPAAVANQMLLRRWQKRQRERSRFQLSASPAEPAAVHRPLVPEEQSPTVLLSKGFFSASTDPSLSPTPLLQEQNSTE